MAAIKKDFSITKGLAYPDSEGLYSWNEETQSWDLN